MRTGAGNRPRCSHLFAVFRRGRLCNVTRFKKIWQGLRFDGGGAQGVGLRGKKEGGSIDPHARHNARNMVCKI